MTILLASNTAPLVDHLDTRILHTRSSEAAIAVLETIKVDAVIADAILENSLGAGFVLLIYSQSLQAHAMRVLACPTSTLKSLIGENDSFGAVQFYISTNGLPAVLRRLAVLGTRCAAVPETAWVN